MDQTKNTKGIKRFLIALAMIAITVPAAGAEAEGASNLFAGDLGNAIWTLAVFLGLLIVLSKFAWNPILGALQGREDFIRDALAKAKDDRDAAEAKLAEYEGILDKARSEATTIVEEGHRDADVLRVKIEEKANAEAEKMLARAKREIALAKDTAKKELFELSGELSTGIASKIIGRAITEADHQRLIDDSIAEIKQLGAN